MASPLVSGGLLTATGVGAIGIDVNGACTIAHIDKIDATTSLNLNLGSIASVYSCQFDPRTIAGSGTLQYLTGDRAAWDTSDYSFEHARDIDESLYTYHNDPNNPPLSGDLGPGSFYIGDSGGNAVATGMSGDVTIDSSGVTTIGAQAVDASNISIANGSIFIGGADGAAHEQSVTGDASISNAGVLTLTTVNADVGTYGDSTHLAQITVDAKGRITAIGSIVFSFSGEVLMADGITPPDPLTLEDETDWLYEG